MNTLSYAFKLLAKKDYFEKELRQKLFQKGFSEKDIEETINYLKKEGYINDEKLLNRYKELAIQKGESELKLKSKLFRKGISNINFSYEEELESALYLLRNKFKKEKNYQNIVKFLKNRGFKYSVIQEATAIFLNE